MTERSSTASLIERADAGTDERSGTPSPRPVIASADA